MTREGNRRMLQSVLAVLAPLITSQPQIAFAHVGRLNGGQDVQTGIASGRHCSPCPHNAKTKVKVQWVLSQGITAAPDPAKQAGQVILAGTKALWQRTTPWGKD